MSYYGFRPYVPVAKRRLLAAREMEKLKKQGRIVSPVVIEGRTIARNFWGKAWCENLERYSDYANRLPRGRSYVRNGLVVDLKIERGQVRAMVSGSDFYSVKIEIGAVSQSRWKAICKDCLGSIGSLVELLQGKLSKNVMERVCREGDGLFPSPREIKMTCSCPDWAGMCKHVAAVLYGAGARLDIAPDLLFTLRGVDRSELIVDAGADLPMARTWVAKERILAEDDIAALFGIEMAPGSLAPGVEETKKNARSVKAAPARRATSSATQPAKESPARKKRPTKKKKKPMEKRSARAATAPSAIEPRQKRTGPAAKSSGARTAPEKIEPLTKTVRALAKPAKKTVSSAELSDPQTETKSRRQNRTKAARWINSRARKRG
jgi:uncharacterized Zn finger protein